MWMIALLVVLGTLNSEFSDDRKDTCRGKRY